MNSLAWKITLIANFIHCIAGSGMEFKEYLVKKNYCPVTALQPYTNYTFAVRSYSRRGASEPSHLTCQTKESGTKEFL